MNSQVARPTSHRQSALYLSKWSSYVSYEVVLGGFQMRKCRSSSVLSVQRLGGLPQYTSLLDHSGIALVCSRLTRKYTASLHLELL